MNLLTDMPRVRAELERLVRIPSVSAAGFPPRPVRESAEVSAEILATSGLSNVQLMTAPALAAHPSVFGVLEGPPNSPTVLLYAHHDVQPPGPEHLWEGPPFEPSEREGRLFGRGVADNKSGLVIHAAALRAVRPATPVTLKVFIDGEEEIGSPSFVPLMKDQPDLLAADVVLSADSDNWRTGIPTLTTSLRGTLQCVVEVVALPKPLHSGSFGGAVPDALTALCRILATLHDQEGNLAIRGLRAGGGADGEVPEDELRDTAGVPRSLGFLGEGPLAARLWSKPSATVLGIDAPEVLGARTLLLDRARALVSLRLSPLEDPTRALELLSGHLQQAAPWGVRVQVADARFSHGVPARTLGPAHAAARHALEQAYGRPVIEVGNGGSVTPMAVLAEWYPGAEILMMGAMDDRSQLHAQDESVDLADLERAILAEALLLESLREDGQSQGAW